MAGEAATAVKAEWWRVVQQAAGMLPATKALLIIPPPLRSATPESPADDEMWSLGLHPTCLDCCAALPACRQVHRDAALAEAEQVEAEAAATRAAAGRSPFNNSRADEAFLRERLDAGIPKGSVLYAAAHKYLAASFQNRSWRFAQRKRMVDVLIRIADHLAAHPPRSHRGSPFSALFQADGPPLVPRISQQASQEAAEAFSLPPGFGGTGAAATTNTAATTN